MAQSARGFTLIELLITLAIASILAMLGAPAMANLLARTQDANTQAAIAGSLRHARAAAVMDNTRILVCPSLDGRHCHQGTEWQSGWLVARDADHDGQPDSNAGILVAQSAVHAGTRVITSVGRQRVVFHPEGNAAGSNARFTVCHARDRAGRSVIVSNTGRVRVAPADPAQLQACLAGLQ